MVPDSTFRAEGLRPFISLAHQAQFAPLVALSEDGGEDWDAASATWIGNFGGAGYLLTAGHVYRNGKRESDGYINGTCESGGGRGCNFTTPITIPAGHWFMMGDNRGESDDSRFWGPVPRKWIIGGAFATYWPPKRIGLL